MEGTTVIAYQGDIRYETIGELIHKFKQQAPLLGIPMGIYKRILLIMIESLENMMKHSNDDIQSRPTGKPEMSIVRRDNKFIIETANAINTEKVGILKARLDLLNNLDQQGLKSLYKETITDGVFTQSGGAGLGLIEIAKISNNPIEYKFEKVDKQYTRYRQLIVVNEK